MKKINFSAMVLLLATIFFSCKKSDSNNEQKAEYEQTVVKWLDKKILESGTGKANMILKSIKENLEFSLSWSSELQDQKSMLVIPISSKCKFANNKNKNVGNYLVIFKTNADQILSGNIWQAHTGAVVSKNTFANIYFSKSEELHGRYTEISLKDNFMRENYYENNKIKESNIRKIKPSSETANSGSLVCNDYYILHTVLDGFGNVLSETVIYEFQVCNCLPTNMVETTIEASSDCDPNIGGGGGASICSIIEDGFNEETISQTDNESFSINSFSDPIGIEKSYNKEWKVVTGIGWSVKANTNILYEKTNFSGSSLSVINIKSLTTSVGGFNGTSIFTKTTWTTSASGPLDQILNNNSIYATTKTTVTGNLKHECTGLGQGLSTLGCLLANREETKTGTFEYVFN